MLPISCARKFTTSLLLLLLCLLLMLSLLVCGSFSKLRTFNIEFMVHQWHSRMLESVPISCTNFAIAFIWFVFFFLSLSSHSMCVFACIFGWYCRCGWMCFSIIRQKANVRNAKVTHSTKQREQQLQNFNIIGLIICSLKVSRSSWGSGRVQGMKKTKRDVAKWMYVVPFTDVIDYLHLISNFFFYRIISST